MARNRSAARLIPRRRAVTLAVFLARTGQDAARVLRADLGGHDWLADLDLEPDPAEAVILVDDKPNPFRDTRENPDACLRGRWDNVVPIATRAQISTADLARKTFQMVSQAGAEAWPDLTVLGKGDGLTDGERAERVRRCHLRKRPFAIIDPIDSIAGFLSVHGESRYASVVIVGRDLQHLVVAVAAGPTLAVAQYGQLLIAQDDGPLLRPGQPVGGPVLPGSYVLLAAPELGGTAACRTGCPRAAYGGAVLAEPANPILLNAILLGGVEAGYQPDCTPCGAAASYIAAVAGRVILDASRGKELKDPHQVHDLLSHALRSGERVPGLVVARDEISARRLLDRVRRYGSA